MPLNWANGVDAKGRPIVNPAADYRNAARSWCSPSPLGGHNWHPMAFDPKTGLVYIPRRRSRGACAARRRASDSPARALEHRHTRSTRTCATSPTAGREVVTRLPDRLGSRRAARGLARAVHQRRGTAARSPPPATSSSREPPTAASSPTARATARRSGSRPPEPASIAAPVTYLVDGVQYVTVMAGWGGVFALAFGEAAAELRVASVGRVLTFKLGGTASLPPEVPIDTSPIPPPPTRDRGRAPKQLRRAESSSTSAAPSVTVSRPWRRRRAGPALRDAPRRTRSVERHRAWRQPHAARACRLVRRRDFDQTTHAACRPTCSSASAKHRPRRKSLGRWMER